MNKLEIARKEINEIDEKMAKLFERRMKACEEVAEYKREHGLSIRDEGRESELINKNLGYLESEEIGQYYIQFLRNNFELSSAYQAKLMNGIKVAVFGEESENSYLAAKKMFPEAEIISCPSYEKAYKAAEEGKVDSVVLPLENNYAGESKTIMDLLFLGNLFVNQVIDLKTPNAKGNVTRFASLSRMQNRPLPSKKREDDNFILMFTVQNESGALAQVLDIIGAHGYNMRSLISCPMKELSWGYYFYLELEGSANNPNGEEMLQELSALCAKLKLIGTYYANNIR